MVSRIRVRYRPRTSRFCSLRLRSGGGVSYRERRLRPDKRSRKGAQFGPASQGRLVGQLHTNTTERREGKVLIESLGQNRCYGRIASARAGPSGKPFLCLRMTAKKGGYAKLTGGGKGLGSYKLRRHCGRSVFGGGNVELEKSTAAWGD